MAVVKITKRVVDATRHADKEVFVWDAELKGYGLRVSPGGVKGYFIQYRVGGGRRGSTRRYSFGGPDSMTAEEARAKARKLLGDVAHGRDPSGERKAKRAELTVAELIERYAENGCVVQRGKRRGQPMKPATKTFTLNRLRHHVLPLLGRKRVGDIRPAHIVQMATDIAAGKTRKDEKGGLRSRTIVRGGEGAARKVVRDLSAVFTYAQHNEIRADNPVENAPVNKQDNKRTRFLDLGEVRQLGAALVDMEARGLNPKAANIARLWALTGFRRNEASGLKRSEIDWERSRAVLGDTKTGVSIRPLGAPALALLASIPPVPGSQYFFPGERGSGFYQGTKRVWSAAIKLAGLAGKVTPHTLRHSVGAAAVSSGESLKFAGALLGHLTVSATAIYAHLAADSSRTVADRVAGTIAAALAGEGDGKVIPLRRGAGGGL
jgi:integrase